MRIRVPHTYALEHGGTAFDSPEGWDAARLSRGPFALPRDRREWEALAGRSDIQARARDVAEIARARRAGVLCSHGVGTAALELAVHRLDPGLRLICTDYAPATVTRLRSLFSEAEIVLRDLTAPDPPHADLHVMHRLDAELPDNAWKAVFARLSEPVLFVPNVLLGLSGALRELARPVRRRGRVVRAGWFRNEAALRSLWCATHDDLSVSVGGAPAFLLEPRGERRCPHARAGCFPSTHER